MKKLLVWRLTLVAAAVLLLTLGLALGQEQGVLRKAMTVCLECIGIG